MLLGVAIGDTFGREFENHNREWIATHLVMDAYPSKECYYTDDTQMTIAVAELMVTGLPFCKESLAAFFMRAYHRDPRTGYSALTMSQLTAGPDSESFLLSLSDEMRNKRQSDGAAMRALPIGLYPDVQDVIHSSYINAESTHGHPHAVAGSLGVAILAHGLYYNKIPYKHIIPYLLSIGTSHFPKDVMKHLENLENKLVFSPEIILGHHNISKGIPYEESLPFLGAVLSLIKHFGNCPNEVLKQAILLGGDTDTVAAVALGAALIIHPFTVLSSFLSDGLESGAYGKDFIIRLGTDLGRCYPVV